MLKSSDNQILNSRNFILYVLFLAICMVCSLTAFGAVEEPVTIETLQQATAASEETTVSAETTTPQQSSKKEISQTDEKTSKETSTQSSPVLSEGGDTEGVLLELTVTTPVSVTALGNTGAATTSIPITVPPGRKGIEPKISLNYNSNSKNGWLGVGWSLDLGAIQRSIKRGVNYSVYDYVFTLNGSSSELVSRGDWGANYYGVKIEGTFSKYYYNSLSGGWEVTTKDGTKYYYGTTLDSRQNNANGVFKWCLDKVQDTNGNYMIITYWKDPVGNDIYLDRIDYTGNISGLNTTNYVKFYLESRTDMPSIYTANSLVKTAYRLKTIEVYGNNQLSRKYVLNYSYSSSTQRSLLTSAVQYGSDGVTYLPESSFGYQERSNQFELETPWGARTQGYSATAGGFRMADVNGDGMADLIYESESGVNPVHVLLSTGSGFVDDNGWGARAHGYNANAVGYQLADVNGDGMADLIYDSDSSVNPVRVLLSTGSGFETDEGWGARTYGYNMNAGGFRMADVNGDGMADLIYDSDSGGGVRVLLSTGSGFETDEGWGARTQGYSAIAGGFRMADVNGDGMADLIYESESGVKPVHVLLSTGSGFETDEGWGAREHGYSINAVGYRMADVNGDGMADLIYDSDSSVNPVRVLLSTGSGFETDEGWGARTYGYNMNAGGFWMTDVNGDGMADLIYDSDSGEKPVRVLLSTGSGFEADNGWGARTRGYNVDAGGFWMTDVNGDGMADLIYDSDSGVNPVRVLKGATPFSDVLATVNNNIGSTYTLEYLPSSVYDNCMDIDGKTVCLPFVVQTLASVAINGGNGIISTTNYTYSGGFYDYIDREFRGFAYVKSTAPNGTTTETWFKQDDIYKGLPFDQITKDSSGNSYTRTSNTYQYTSPYTGVNFPYLYQKDDYVYDGTSTAKQAETQFIYDSYGNITRKHFLGDISISGDERDEYTEYTYDTTNWIVALPSHVYVNDSSGATKSQAWFTYDTKGNLWTKTMWLNGGTNPVITYGYDPYGNQASMTDAKGNTTTTAYDSTYTYPTVTTNPLGHVITRTYDLKFGKVLTETDVNVNTTTYEYDVFGRTKKITKPMPYGITEYFYQNFGNVSSQNIREEKKDQASVLLHWKETYFDGLGRTRREKSSGPGASTIIVDTEYNNKGLVYTKSLPYYDGGTVYKTTYTYDPMDRLIQTLTPNYPNYTSSSIEYLKDRTTYIDDNGHKKVVEKDIYEKIIKVEEYTGVSPSFTLYATTQYAYDVLNNLTRVTDEYGNLTEITNDTLSRKTSMHDPDMGYWTYQYDANGNLISQTDAKNQTITFTYDALNRITKKDYPTGTDITYTYDELFSTNPIGKQTTLTDSSGTTKFYYDAMGQITRTDKTIDSMLYITQTQYDSLGRVKKIIYPDSAEVDYTYDGNGNIKDIISGTQTYLTYNSYNAFAQPLSVTNGNGVTTQYQYYAQNNRLFSITTNSPTQGGLMNFTYSYDSAGNITSIDDLMDNNKDRTYTYDDLDRLIGANSLSYGGNLIYQYDKTGNMTYNCKYGYYFYDDLNHIHAVTKIKKADGTLIDSYSYDANGNMTGGAGRALTYNYDNMPTSIGYNNNATINVYDANGIRVKKVTPTSTTVYIGQTYECANGVCMKYIMSGTQIIAQISGSDTNYYHTDHLGSSSIITDNTGNKVEDIYYYPYGEIKTNTGSANVRYKYTGKEFDAEDGLYYYGARYYDPRLARFISADTIVPLPFYPQTFNRYAYAYNNPIVLRDLDGHEPGDYWDYYDYYDYDDYYDYSSYYDYNNNSYQNSYYNSYSYGNSSYSDYSWSSYSSSNSSWNSYNSYSWGDYSLTDRYRQSNSYNEVLVDRSKNTISFQNNTFEIRYGRLGPGEYKIDYIGTGFSRENPLETKKARGESYGTAYIGLAGTSMDIHGGGKGAKTEAWAPVQGWYPTQGCYRMQNRDINALSIDLNSYRNSTGGYPIVRIQE